MMKIAFVVEGGRDIGMGHIYRTLTVAQEWEGDATKLFVTKSPDQVIWKIVKAGFEALKCRDDLELLETLSERKPDIVIIDRLDISKEFAYSIKGRLETKLVVFENLLPESSKYCDVVVNAILGRQFGGEVRNEKVYDDKTGTIYFYGPKYLLLKEDFLEFGKKGKDAGDGSIDSVLVIFGGSDPGNLTGEVLRLLLQMGRIGRIDVVLGHYFCYFDEIEMILRDFGQGHKPAVLHRDAGNVAELMYKADLVITAPGISVFEALCVGTPVIVIHQSEWQKEGFGGYRETLGKDDVFSIKDLIDRREVWGPGEEFTKSLEIGRGKSEVMREILRRETL